MLSPAFCPDCGSACLRETPDGDHRERSVCTSCRHIHYVNPKVVVGCIVEAGDHLLLAKRNIEPAHGRWTFPAGYLECGESSFDGAARETKEETEAEVQRLGLHAVLDIPHIGQIYKVYRARLVGTHFAETPESSEVRLIGMADIPWADLAFPSVAAALRLYARDREAGDGHRVHTGSVTWTGQGSRFDLAQYSLLDHHAH